MEKSDSCYAVNQLIKYLCNTIKCSRVVLTPSCVLCLKANLDHIKGVPYTYRNMTCIKLQANGL
jgi:hypothetical protein